MSVIRDDADERMARIEAMLEDLRRKTADLSELAEKTTIQVEESRAFRQAANEYDADGLGGLGRRRRRARPVARKRR